MKTKVTFVEISYTPNGYGKAILIIRGSLMRVYKHSQRRTDRIFSACDKMDWEDRFYPQKMTIQPKKEHKKEDL